VHLCGTLEETGVQVEDITWVGFTSWWTSEEERHLTVSDSLLGQVIKDDEGVLAVLQEVLAHGGTGVRREVLERGSIRGRGRNDDGVLHGVSVGKTLDELGNGGPLLANSRVDAVKLLAFIRAVVEPSLVDNGVNGDGSLASLTITDDQFTLTPADWHEGVNSLDASLHWFGHGLPRNNARCLDSNSGSFIAWDRTVAVNWVAEGIDNTSEETLADWDIDNGTSTLDDVTFLDQLVVTENDNTDISRFQVEGHTLKARGEFNHLFSLAVAETVDTGNTITYRQHTARFFDVGSGCGSEDTLFED